MQTRVSGAAAELSVAPAPATTPAEQAPHTVSPLQATAAGPSTGEASVDVVEDSRNGVPKSLPQPPAGPSLGDTAAPGGDGPTPEGASSCQPSVIDTSELSPEAKQPSTAPDGTPSVAGVGTSQQVDTGPSPQCGTLPDDGSPVRDAQLVAEQLDDSPVLLAHSSPAPPAAGAGQQAAAAPCIDLTDEEDAAHAASRAREVRAPCRLLPASS